MRFSDAHYLESTIPSYVVARPARDLLQAARQQLTRDWWDLKRETHELFTSQIVLDEIAFGEKEMAARRLQVVGKVLASGLLPVIADRDATHIALASAYELDILLTWNCRHIANPMIQQRLRRVVEAGGFTLPVICTPEHPAGRELPVAILDLAEFDLGLDLIPMDGLREQLDIDALLMGDLLWILLDKRVFMNRRLGYRLASVASGSHLQ